MKENWNKRLIEKKFGYLNSNSKLELEVKELLLLMNNASKHSIEETIKLLETKYNYSDKEDTFHIFVPPEFWLKTKRNLILRECNFELNPEADISFCYTHGCYCTDQLEIKKEAKQ